MGLLYKFLKWREKKQLASDGHPFWVDTRSFPDFVKLYAKKWGCTEKEAAQLTLSRIRLGEIKSEGSTKYLFLKDLEH